MIRFSVIFWLLPLLVVSCSPSRMVDADRVLDAGPQSIGSLIDSDVLVADGTILQANYVSGSRIFVTSGGELTGLTRGSKESVIFAEQGAILPSVDRRSVRVKRVDDATEAFQDRFRNLLPSDAQGGTGAGAGGVAVAGGPAFVGGGLYGGGFFRGWGGGRGGGRNFNNGGRSRSSASVRGGSSGSRF